MRGWTAVEEFIDPDRNPSVSKVTNVNPSALKTLVSSENMGMVSAEGSSAESISILTISP
jgi:hypothetical protein